MLKKRMFRFRISLFTRKGYRKRSGNKDNLNFIDILNLVFSIFYALFNLLRDTLKRLVFLLLDLLLNFLL